MQRSLLFKIILLFLTVLIVIPIFSQDVSGDNSTKTTVKKMNGWDYYAAGRYRESIKELKKEQRQFPERVNIYVIMGWDYLEMRNYSEMEKVSKDGLKINPTDSRLIKNYAEACFFQNKYDKAITMLEKFISYRYKVNDPYLKKVYYLLGICFYKTDSLHKADIAFSTAIHYNRSNINAIIGLADTKFDLEQKEKAHDLYKQALTLQPDNLLALEGISKSKEE